MESFLTPYGLSNSGQEKLQFTPFWGGPKPGSSDGLRAGTIESHNFFVLSPIRVKFHILTRLIESFPMIFWTWWCAEEKLHFTPFHTLCQLKRDEALFPPLWISLADRNWLKNLTRQIFSACLKFWWQSVQRCRNCMTKPVRTCPQHSDHVRSLRNAFFCTYECS